MHQAWLALEVYELSCVVKLDLNDKLHAPAKLIAWIIQPHKSNYLLGDYRIHLYLSLLRKLLFWSRYNRLSAWALDC